MISIKLVAVACVIVGIIMQIINRDISASTFYLLAIALVMAVSGFDF